MTGDNVKEDSISMLTLVQAMATLTEKVTSMEKRLDRTGSQWPTVLAAIAIVISLADKIPWAH